MAGGAGKTATISTARLPTGKSRTLGKGAASAADHSNHQGGLIVIDKAPKEGAGAAGKPVVGDLNSCKLEELSAGREPSKMEELLLPFIQTIM